MRCQKIFSLGESLASRVESSAISINKQVLISLAEFPDYAGAFEKDQHPGGPADRPRKLPPVSLQRFSMVFNTDPKALKKEE